MSTGLLWYLWCGGVLGFRTQMIKKKWHWTLWNPNPESFLKSGFPFLNSNWKTNQNSYQIIPPKGVAQNHQISK